MEKTEDGKKWVCQEHGYRLGSINSNAGGWKNGKRTSSSIVEAEDPTVKFEFPCSEPLGVLSAVVQLREVGFSYLKADRQKALLADHKVKVEEGTAPSNGSVRGFTFHGVNMSIDMNSKIAVVGKNGAGKSTLLNMIVGNTQPSLYVTSPPFFFLGLFVFLGNLSSSNSLCLEQGRSVQTS